MPDEKLRSCPHCGHHAYEPNREKARDAYGQWDWVIRCSSSHCRSEVSIVADGWQEGERTRLTDLRAMWNRRLHPDR